MDAVAAELTAIAGREHVLTDPDVTAGYATDWTRRFHGLAHCVVRPRDTSEVARVLLACARHGLPVVPQGGNTGLVGGGVPPGRRGPRAVRQAAAQARSGRRGGVAGHGGRGRDHRRAARARGPGGTISAEHGIGRAKAAILPVSRSAAEIAAMRAIKHALDPAGLLNPGVLFLP
jgi:FAD/FMN-containing dehydrogenase